MTEELKTVILDEILRLSKLIYDDKDIKCDCENHLEHKMEIIKLFSFTINRLVMLLDGSSTIDDFHDSIVSAPEQVRQFYINLLFVEI